MYISEPVLMIILLILVYTIFWHRNRQSYFRDLLSLRDADIHYLNKEYKKVEEDNLIIKKNTENKNNEIMNLKYNILKINRVNNKSIITVDELKYFANDQKNKIEYRQCDKNSKKVFEEFFCLFSIYSR